jgi:hypothetical protein
MNSLPNWLKRSVIVVLLVKSTAGVYLDFIPTFSPSLGVKRGEEVGGVERLVPQSSSELHVLGRR